MIGSTWQSKAADLRKPGKQTVTHVITAPLTGKMNHEKLSPTTKAVKGSAGKVPHGKLA